MCAGIPKAGNKNNIRITIPQGIGPSEHTFKVPAGSAVRVLKHKIAADMHWCERSFYLLYYSHVLQDEEQLPEDCYNGASMIELQVRSPGGAGWFPITMLIQPIATIVNECHVDRG